MPNREIWIRGPKGIPSVSLVYHLLKSNKKIRVDTRSGYWIWKCDTIPQIKYFIWFCNHDRISLASMLHKREMDISPLCKMYGNQKENTIHIFRDSFGKYELIWVSLRVV